MTPPEDRVPLRQKLGLGAGGLAAFFGYAGVSTLAYPVYNMTLGVSAAAVGVALLVPRLWDAVSDPLMGRITDNAQTRWGRRRPFVLLGAPLMGLLFVAIWYAPPGWSDAGQLAWFIAAQLLFFTAYTVFAVPFGAMSYEMTPDHHERTRVMASLAFFHKVGELLSGWMLPLAALLGVAIVGAAVVPAPGEQQRIPIEGVHAMAWIVGLVFLAGFGVLPALAVRGGSRVAPAAVTAGPKVKLTEGLRAAAGNSAFLLLVGVIVLNTLSGVLATGIDQYLLVYFMSGGNQADGLVQKGLLTTGYGVVGFASIPVITWFATRFGKKQALYGVYGLMAVGGVAKWFVFTPGHPRVELLGVSLDPVILIDPLLCGPMWVAVKILLASMMADVCDEDELRHGQRREGLFGAVFSWLEKTVVSVAYLGTGLALAATGFVIAKGAAQSDATFTGMRLFLAGAPTATALLAIVVLRFYPLSAERAEATRTTLEARRGRGRG